MSEDNGAGGRPVADEQMEDWVRKHSQSPRDTEMLPGGEKNGLNPQDRTPEGQDANSDANMTPTADLRVDDLREDGGHHWEAVH